MHRSTSRSKLSESKFRNWIKSGLAIKYAKDGLQSFVLDEISAFQRKSYEDILKDLKLPKGTQCTACGTDSIIYGKRKRCASLQKPCPESGLCNQFEYKIVKAHRYHGPSWDNTNAKLWCSEPWQVAKCYMPREGYAWQKTPDDTDFNGIVSVILNHEHISSRLSADLTDKNNNIFRKAQQVSKDLRHTASFEVEDDTFQANLVILKTVLQVKEIAEYNAAKEALNNLQELSDLEWSVFTTSDDIFSVMQTACDSKETEPDTDEGKEKLEMLRLAMKVIEANKRADTQSIVCQMQSSINKYQEKQNLRRNLIETYEQECSTLPISALFEEEDAPLLDFYVSPLMQQIEHHKVRKKYMTVKSYYDIFHKEEQPCRNIYITGDAGTGKTALCQKMLLCWCHAHNEGSVDNNFSQEDIDVHFNFCSLCP